LGDGWRWAKKIRTDQTIVFLGGEPEVADKSSLGKPNWLRIKVACSRPELIGGVNSVYINGHSYRIRWEVEGDYAAKSNIPPEDRMGRIVIREILGMMELKKM
jgi:hypothetical protein